MSNTWSRQLINEKCTTLISQQLLLIDWNRIDRSWSKRRYQFRKQWTHDLTLPFQCSLTNYDKHTDTKLSTVTKQPTVTQHHTSESGPKHIKQCQLINISNSPRLHCPVWSFCHGITKPTRHKSILCLCLSVCVSLSILADLLLFSYCYKNAHCCKMNLVNYAFER